MIFLKRTTHASEGRDGSVKTPNNSLNLKLSKPVEMGGSPSNHTNPEELFLAGYTTCLASSFEFLSQKAGVVYSSLAVDGDIYLQEDETLGGFEFKVNVVFDIQGMDESKKQEMVNQTFGFCPFSKAIKNNVKVDYEIK